MSNLTIQRVATARQKKQFLHFPGRLPERSQLDPAPAGDAKEMVNFRPHPFYERKFVPNVPGPAQRRGLRADRRDL